MILSLRVGFGRDVFRGAVDLLDGRKRTGRADCNEAWLSSHEVYSSTCYLQEGLRTRMLTHSTVCLLKLLVRCVCFFQSPCPFVAISRLENGQHHPRKLQEESSRNLCMLGRDGR